MPTNSQFLYTYTDQFTDSEWVNWTEGVLASPPNPKFNNKTGFQRALGAINAGPRTRANEAYRLGYLRAPLVDSRFKQSHAMPLGWASVVNGNAPHSILGFHSYVISRALQENNDSSFLRSALNDLAAVQILHIGFERGGRWYSTVALFEFAKSVFEQQIKRNSTDDELLYLSAALINTLDGPAFDDFLDAYSGKNKLKKLYYTFRNSGSTSVKLNEIEEIAATKSIDLDTIERRRAHRYWAKPERGIYSRAISGRGASFLREFAIAEQARFVAGANSAMIEIYESIALGGVAADIFELAPELFSAYGNLLVSWQELYLSVRSAARLTIENTDFEAAPSAWKVAQRAIFGTGKAVVSDFELSALEIAEDKGEDKVKTSGTKGTTKISIGFPAGDDLVTLVEAVDGLFTAPPKAKEKLPKKSVKRRVISESSRQETDNRNSKIGKSGEEFVYLSEKRRLSGIGKPNFADLVLWASHEIGDGLGYDIMSYDDAGQKIFIEVKTTSGGIGTPFFLSANELEVSKEKGNRFKIYRLFNYPKEPKVYEVEGPLHKSLDLTPTNYRAMPA